ncbi:unnamed protein product [Enterobius vermicularis]|uniref:BHLH domain-containing protein n=1 Tax=Enterobius vermicularis TaxID=51028 RepID=A0A0N4UWF6_ENTVE|nr:unnamed protein product [Enterobius vermicularis]
MLSNVLHFVTLFVNFRMLWAGEGWTETDSQQSPAPPPASTSNHSEIEKRRRDRMNELIGELSALVPAASNRKLDKLSVLRLALQHIASLTSNHDGSADCGASGETLPITELIVLIEKSTNGFLMVADVETANIVYVSDAATKCLGISAEDLINRNCFDILHPEDVRTFRDEIMTTHLNSRLSSEIGSDYVNDCVSSSTNYYPQPNEMDIGLKRSFFCRININAQRKQNEKAIYQKFKCSGVLREGKSLRAVLVSSALGYLPNELLAISYYDLVNEVLRTMESRQASYRLRAASEESVMCSCIWQPFSNPWTEQLQFIVLLHTTGYPRKDKELTAEQSILKQLLSKKKASTTVLGAARFGNSVSS